MTVEQFLKSLSDLMWSCFWVMVIFLCSEKQQKVGGNRMTRPNRYPYTKNQWEETTTAVYSYNNGEYELFRYLENKFTGERVEVK